MFEILSGLVGQHILILLPNGATQVTVVAVTPTVATFLNANAPNNQNNITMSPDAVTLLS